METVTVEIDDLKRALNKLNLNYPEEKLKVLSEKEVYRINNAIEIIENSFNSHNIKDDKNDYFLIEILVEYVAIMTMSLADVAAITLKQIFNLPDNSRNIYFHNIDSRLNDKNQIEKGIINQIKAIIDMNDYKYINAMCNYVKHNSITDTQILIKIPSKNAILLAIKEFTHKNIPYQKKTIKDFIECHYAVKNELFRIFQIFIDYEQLQKR